MRETALTELRNRAGHDFDLVEAGEAVHVLRNGKPIAEILPIPRDLLSWLIGDATPHVVQKSIALIEAWPLHAMDALHVGATLACAADAFDSADARRFDGARHFGLQVVRV